MRSRTPRQGSYRRSALLVGGTLGAALAAVALAGCGSASGASSAGTTTPSTPAGASTPGAATGGASTPSAATVTASAAGAAVARCAASALRVSLGEGEGAAGSVVRPVVFVNRSASTCSLRGFPGVAYVTGTGGHQVGAPAARSGPPGALVTLRPGGRATAALRLVNVGTFDPAACRPVTTLGLRVYPPGSTAALFVPATGTGCSSTTSAQLFVQAVRAAP